jgi:hypothetical protein
MNELHERIDKEIDDFEAIQHNLRYSEGMSERNRNLMTRERFQVLQETAKKFEARRK